MIMSGRAYRRGGLKLDRPALPSISPKTGVLINDLIFIITLCIDSMLSTVLNLALALYRIRIFVETLILLGDGALNTLESCSLLDPSKSRVVNTSRQ